MAKLVSLSPSNTELLDFMGLTSEIVGVDNFSDWPSDVHDLPKLGPDLAIDMDVVESLQPDLVVASLSVPGMEKNIERLQERDLPFIVLNPSSFANIGENILTVGKALGKEKLAQHAYRRYHQLYEAYVESSYNIIERPTLYWEWWPKPVFTPGGANWLTELSELAGGRNVFADTPLASVRTDWEDVRTRNPDYVFTGWCGIKKEKIRPDRVSRRPGWPAMKALKNGHIHVVGDVPFCRPSPRLLMGVQQVRFIIHPGVYQPVDAKKAEEWYYGNT